MIHNFNLKNGLSVLVEEMSHVESASYDLLIPGGYVVDPADKVGASLILAELIGRGAGPYDSRELSERFDAMGIRHGEGAGTDRYGLSGSLVGDALSEALRLVSYMVTQPTLPEDDIPNIQSVLLQDIDSLSDNPARRSMIELTRRYYPAPYNRPSLGEGEGIKGCSRGSLVDLYKRCFGPGKAILSIAGRVDANQVRQEVEQLFGEWKGSSAEIPVFGEMPKNEYFHVPYDSSQMQIVVASPSVRFNDDGYYSGKIAVSLLGASMFGRLFVELREKRGLCYSVYARHGSTMSYGTVTAYVGTTPERAQESLDVLVEEMSRLRGTVTIDELERAKTNLKAALVMGEESPSSRAASNATDWWFLKRIRPLSEINQEIDKVSIDSVNEFLDLYPFRPASLLTLGKHELKVPHGLIKGDR